MWGQVVGLNTFIDIFAIVGGFVGGGLATYLLIRFWRVLSEPYKVVLNKKKK